MRDILFKAKRIDNGEWIKGYYFYNPNIEKSFIHNWLSGGLVEVQEDTLCQYTGLTDKNGNKIWENDICAVLLITTGEFVKENFVVRYGRRADNCKIELGFNVEWTKTAYLRNDICFWTENREVEVIGNIFDNPELLKGGAV